MTWYGEKGIDHEVTAPYSPQSNLKAERVNRTVKGRARAKLAESGMGDELWAEAAVAATYVMNWSPKEGLVVTPWESSTGKRPDVSGVAVWGNTALTLKPLKQQSGVTPRTIVGRMFGHTPGGRAYRILLERTRTVIVRRDLAFDEVAPTTSTKEVHWDLQHDGETNRSCGGTPPATPTMSPKSTPTLRPSSSGGGG